MKRMNTCKVHGKVPFQGVSFNKGMPMLGHVKLLNLRPCKASPALISEEKVSKRDEPQRSQKPQGQKRDTNFQIQRMAGDLWLWIKATTYYKSHIYDPSPFVFDFTHSWKNPPGADDFSHKTSTSILIYCVIGEFSQLLTHLMIKTVFFFFIMASSVTAHKPVSWDRSVALD